MTSAIAMPVRRFGARFARMAPFALVAFAVASAAGAQPAAAPSSSPTPPVANANPADAGQPSLDDDKRAIDAGRNWLEQVDAGKTGPLWDNAAKSLKSTVTRQQWIDGVRDMRKPFGKLASRNATKFARAHELPDAPAGDYAIVQFESKFANGRQATEQIVWMLDGDGVFRVSGYHIR